jgi:hypothetical protein
MLDLVMAEDDNFIRMSLQELEIAGVNVQVVDQVVPVGEKPLIQDVHRNKRNTLRVT